MATCTTGDFTFNTGHQGVSFYSVATEATVTLLIEAGDHSLNACFIDYIQLSCASGGLPAIYDGSGGSSVTGRLCCGTGTFQSQDWDFRDDPLVCLGGDNTQTICVSASTAGLYQGFIKYHWGSIPG